MLLFLHGRPEHSVCVPAALSPLVADNAQISDETAVWARNLNIFPCSFTEPVTSQCRYRKGQDNTCTAPTLCQSRVGPSLPPFLQSPVHHHIGYLCQ